MKIYDVVVVGGGLAGLTSALHLTKQGFQILVIEKNEYPNHKVCGEYVSNEVRPYLSYLGVDFNSKNSIEIDTLQMSTRSGKSIETKLPLGGFGISRYALDNMLYNTAKDKEVSFLFETVSSIIFDNDSFEVTVSSSEKYKSRIVIGAYGKRSGLDKKLNRKFILQKSPWLGVKCHYEFDNFPSNLVALHNFKGGYGGLSKIENGAINFCYLANFESFKLFNSIKEFNQHIVSQNPFLKEFLDKASPKFKKPLSIAQISFEKKRTVENHVIMCGDSAGLIHPLCGNGMAMAIHSAKIASDCITDYLNSKNADRNSLENKYALLWREEFEARLRMGRIIQRLLMNNTVSEMAIGTIAKSEKILQTMIKRTHGSPILVKCS
ncbi:NAD(P)/FAD-dependent oxidoreductase [uncultured Croceitalea sp.]|uniref:NAD(P)/FAD-dependent oxidoreductase n=1 Tax=uncultured Croceitalea sp. TaxID=1798908 RepID=UPI00374F3588